MRTKEQKARLITWAEALESGKYKQCRGALCFGGAYCVAGVACDLAAPDIGAMWDDSIYGVGHKSFRTGSFRSSLTPPPTMLDYYGLTRGELGALITDNEMGEPFPEIAARIRALAESAS